MKDTNTLKGNWKIAEVISVDMGRDKLVRTVKLGYKVCKPGVTYTGQKDKVMDRSVHRLVVLVPAEERNV